MSNFTKTFQMRVAGVLIGGVFIFMAGPAQAVPIQNADKCEGPVTIGVATCPDKPGHWVECTNHGDYMCCVKNEQGGKNCDQIENKTSNPMGGIKRFQGGVLENPMVNPSPNTSRFPKTGARAPIMRRGLDGEQTGEPASGESDQTDQSGETK